MATPCNKLILLKPVTGLNGTINPRGRVAQLDPFGAIQRQLTIAKQNGIEIIVKDRHQADTFVVSLDYVGERWARGHTVSLTGEYEMHSPFTINYSDVLVDDIRIDYIQ